MSMALQYGRNDHRDSPRAFIEVLENEAIVVSHDGKAGASFGAMSGKGVADGAAAQRATADPGQVMPGAARAEQDSAPCRPWMTRHCDDSSFQRRMALLLSMLRVATDPEISGCSEGDPFPCACHTAAWCVRCEVEEMIDILDDTQELEEIHSARWNDRG